MVEMVVGEEATEGTDVRSQRATWPFSSKRDRKAT